MTSSMEIDFDNGAASFDPQKFNAQVRQAIEKFKQSPGNHHRFSSPQSLKYQDNNNLLKILMETRLGSCEIDVSRYLDECDKCDELLESFEQAYLSGSFADLINHPYMPSQFHEGTLGVKPSGNPHSLKGAFEERFEGSIHKRFIQTLNEERASYPRAAAQRPYNWSISVVQSSGTGKSRMVDEVANIVFTIPINLREDLGPGHKKTFPPPDPAIRKYFNDRKNYDNERQKADYALLLQALFDGASQLIQSLWPNLPGEDLAQKWASYLRENETERKSGANRQNFFAAAVLTAEENAKAVKGTLKKYPTLDFLHESLQKSCNELINILAPHCGSKTNACFVSFDEAHALTKIYGSPEDVSHRSAYHNLGTVMSTLVNCSAFFIFLSTNSNFETFAPPPSRYSSGRVKDGSQLIPSFNELPFDLYRKDALRKIGFLSLANVCKTQVIVASGRPLWYSTHKAYPEKDIFKFAMDKLVADGVDERRSDAEIAAVAVRVGITFDRIHAAVLNIQSRLVTSHMRVVYSVPRHRAYMHTGYPSEPILAEVAGRYFKDIDRYGFPKEGPGILARACDEGFIAHGERGELVGRLLTICAYEDGLDTYFAGSPHLQPSTLQPCHHHPIPLCHFICALFRETYSELILGAKPITAISGADTLGTAFSNSYVFFSHFALARDQEMLSWFGLASALTRGMALQAKECQESIDAVIPIHMGSLTDQISPKTTSAINLQFKNRKKAEVCHVDRMITVKDKSMPTISIVFELGVVGEQSNLVEIKHQARPTTWDNEAELHHDDHHYQITVYGCSSTVFGAVRPDAQDDYKAILRGASVVADFPRKANVEALYQLNPDFSGAFEEKRDPNLFSDWSKLTTCHIAGGL